MPDEDEIILFLDFSLQLKNTSDLVFLSIVTKPIISSFSLVWQINLISKDIVTQGFPFEHLCAAVPAPASMIAQM